MFKTKEGSLMKDEPEGMMLWPAPKEMEFHLLLDVRKKKAGLGQKTDIFFPSLYFPKFCLCPQFAKLT